jgi:microcompartment protein CcmL/EutN
LLATEKIDAGLVTAIVRGEVAAVKLGGRCRSGGGTAV